MNITIDNRDYRLDTEKAIKEGSLFPIPTPGDVYGSGPIVIVLVKNYEGKWIRLNASANYYAFSEPPKTTEQMIDFLKEGHWTRLGCAASIRVIHE